MDTEKVTQFIHHHTITIALTFFVVLFVALFVINKGSLISSKGPVVSPSITKTPTPTPFKNWKIYENKRRGFTVLIPQYWNVDEIDGRAIFTPSKKEPIGSLTEITITILPNPAKDQPLTTKVEFNEWLAKDAKTEIPEKGRLYKLDNLNIAGLPSVTLVDLGKVGEQDKDDWSLITWFRKDKTNYYINAKGNKKLSDADIKAYNYLIGSFTFTKE